MSFSLDSFSGFGKNFSDGRAGDACQRFQLDVAVDDCELEFDRRVCATYIFRIFQIFVSF